MDDDNDQDLQRQQRTKEILRQFFNEIDTDRSGFIDYPELKSLMSHSPLNHGDDFSSTTTSNTSELDKVWLSLKAIDDNNDNRISFPEFERAFSPLVQRQLQKQQRYEQWQRWLGMKNSRNNDDTGDIQGLISMDTLIYEWQGLAENLNIGSDISMYIPPTQQDEIPLWRYVVTGMTSGALGRLLMAPLEKASLMQQVSGHGFVTECRRALELGAKEGYLKTLWTGAGWNSFRVAIFSGLSTTGTAVLYQHFPVPAFRDETEEATYDWREPAYRGMLGAGAGLVATILTHPLDVIRTRVTLNDVHPTLRGSEALAESENAVETVRAITDTGGTRALWRGLVPAAIGVVPFCAAHHCLFDLFKHWTHGSTYQDLPKSLDVSTVIGCGVAAGMGAQTLVYPLEVIRRRQIEMGSSGTKTNYTMKSATRAILRDGGVPGLFAGLFPAYLRVAPAVVVSLLVRHNVVARLDGK
jgi:solute carrier family 25 (mitochondrial phosphate transporter), member 23/24/25/41